MEVEFSVLEHACCLETNGGNNEGPGTKKRRQRDRNPHVESTGYAKCTKPEPVY